MDISKMEYDFLVKSVLGREITIDGELQTISESIIEACIAKADRDMLTAGCNYLISGKKEERRKSLLDLLDKFDYSFSRNMLSEYSNVISTMVRVDRVPRDKDVSYGLAQKSVNMAFKYFYVFKSYIVKDLSFSNCDCPIDSVVLEALGKKDVLWSQVSSDEYKFIQEQIKSELKKKESEEKECKDLYNEIGNLLFDFINW